MTNIISLSVPHRRQPFILNADAFFSVFTDHRRHNEDVFWPKENAELLTIFHLRERQYPKTPWQPINPFTNSPLQI